MPSRNRPTCASPAAATSSARTAWYPTPAGRKSTAHLPYEVLVSGNKVYALYARFRIAINFPDLSMMGANSFMNIMDAPEAIRKALQKTVEN